MSGRAVLWDVHISSRTRNSDVVTVSAKLLLTAIMRGISKWRRVHHTRLRAEQDYHIFFSRHHDPGR